MTSECRNGAHGNCVDNHRDSRACSCPHHLMPTPTRMVWRPAIRPPCQWMAHQQVMS